MMNAVAGIEVARARPIAIRGTPVANGRVPLVCAPLMAPTPRELLAEAGTVMLAGPDVVEWRADAFRDLADARRVVDTAQALRGVLGAVPLLVTARSPREGGACRDLGEEAAAELLCAVCAAGCAELIDFEMSNDPARMRRVRAASAAAGVGLIASYHHFSETPPAPVLLEHFSRAQALGADVAKVAVMPRSLDDVLTLLAATLQASRSLDIPLISLSMGATGTLTRTFGWAFGSALTFGVGVRSSAPGQLPIDELKAVIALARKAMA